MVISPLVRQIFVASSPQLAALSSGAVIGYPAVLLQQFKANDTSIHVDNDAATWIASVHGVAGIPSLLMPTIMQLKGRRFAFIMSCLLIITGWITICSAASTQIIILGESFQGLGIKSLIVVSYLTINEMVDPKFRNISVLFYGVNQILGITLAHIMGRYLHWKTIGLGMCSPVILALIISVFWPESPIWLAYKGKFDKCEKAFIWLRGKDNNSRKELDALVNAQRIKMINKSDQKKPLVKNIWATIGRKDFYLPSMHMFVLLSMYYWSGNVVLLIYSMNMIEQATENEEAAFIGMILIDVITLVGSVFSWVFLKYCRNKPVLLSSGAGSSFFLLGASIITYLQSIQYLPRDSLLCLYFLVGFTISSSLGIFSLTFSMAAELMPVKYRGAGGALYVIYLCTLHTSSVKLSPYLFKSIGLHGTFLVYVAVLIFCMSYIWKFVPETKNKTLQQIEDYYAHGDFVSENVTMNDIIGKVPIVKCEVVDAI